MMMLIMLLPLQDRLHNIHIPPTQIVVMVRLFLILLGDQTSLDTMDSLNM